MKQPIKPFVTGQRVRLRDKSRDRTFNAPGAALTVVECEWNPERRHYSLKIHVEIPNVPPYCCFQPADDFEACDGDGGWRSLVSVLAIAFKFFANY